jgi:hypothetical protein
MSHFQPPPQPAPGQAPPPQSFPYPPHPGQGQPANGSQRRRANRGWVILAIAAAVAAVFGAALAGVAVGAHLNRTTSAPSPTSEAPTPTSGQVRNETVDLCTRYAAAWAAIPTPQKTGQDIIPAANYITNALRDNPNADDAIRAAITESLRLMREQAAALSNQAPQGAVQPPPLPWKPDAANAADHHVWDLCHGYGG